MALGEKSFDGGFATGLTLGVEVAHGDNFREFRVGDAGHVVRLRAAARANVADANAVARCIGAEEPRWHDQRSDRCGGECRPHEIAAGGVGA